MGSLDKVTPSPIISVMGWKRDLPDGVIDICQAAPDYPPAEALCDYLRECVRERPEVFRYSPAFGLPEARTAAAADLSRAYAADVSAEQVALTAGCNQAFCAVAAALCERGDEVILPLPYYFNHAMWLDATGVRGVFPPFVEHESDADFVERIAAAVTPRTRAIVVVTPDNPTGRTRTPQTLARLFELAAQRGVTLILDETYRMFRPDETPPHALFDAPDWPRHFVHLYSYSKTFSLPGMRVGMFAGAPDLLAAGAKWLDCAAICPPAVGQLAAAYGLQSLADWVAQRRAEKLDLQARFAELMSDSPGGYELIEAGAFFAWLRHPHSEPAAETARRLAFEHGVLCLPGSAFGPGCDAYLRLSVANAPAARLPDIVAALRADTAA